jgi:hypothetical protein
LLTLQNAIFIGRCLEILFGIKEERKDSMVNRDIEDATYDQVAAELAENDIQPGLMAKAIAKSKGDDKKAKSLYIELRAEQLVRHLKRAARDHRREQRNITPVPKSPPDTPLQTFTIKNPSEGLMGTKYQLTIRENTLYFLNLKTNEDLILDPQKGNFGLELHSPLISYDHIVLINPEGERLVFRADGKIVNILKSWWKRRKPK